MTIKEKIIRLFERNNKLSVKEITDNLLVSKQMVHLVLTKQMEENKVVKYGRVPKTVYRFIDIPDIDHKKAFNTSDDSKTFLNEHFLVISEVGNMLEGIEGFDYWCRKRNLPLQKLWMNLYSIRKNMMLLKVKKAI